jgi:hypothetical protein
MTYLTTMSVAQAIASSDGVISKQCLTGCEVIWSATDVPRQNYTMETTIAVYSPHWQEKKPILHQYECPMAKFPLHTLEHTGRVSLKQCGPRFDLPWKDFELFPFHAPGARVKLWVPLFSEQVVFFIWNYVLTSVMNTALHFSATGYTDLPTWNKLHLLAQWKWQQNSQDVLKPFWPLSDNEIAGHRQSWT